MVVPDTPLTPSYVRTLVAFIADCHCILDALIGADTEALRAMPLLSGLRGPYAFKALAMLERRADDRKHRMSQIVDHDTIRWLHYARIMSRLLEEASANGLFVAPTLALRIRNRAVDQDRLQHEVHTGDRPGHQPTEMTLPIIGADELTFDSLEYDWPDFDLSPELWDLFPMDNEQFQNNPRDLGRPTIQIAFST